MYSKEQKEILSQLFASTVFRLIQERRDARMGDVTERMFKQMKTLSWCESLKSKSSALKHLEDAGVYGVYDMPEDKHVMFYISVVYSAKFSLWFSENLIRNLTEAAFLRAFAKSSAQKPTAERLTGRRGVTGRNRNPLWVGVKV
jgi:hypothetical protein